nr:hypothetical protein [Tanacetum cinerariifolium]
GGGGEVFGGGVFGGSIVFSGDGVGNGVRGMVRRRSAMGEAPSLSSKNWVPEKDRCIGAKDKFMRWKGVRVTKASKRARHDTSVECFVYYKKQGHVTTGFELHCYWGDQDVDAKENDYW